MSIPSTAAKLTEPKRLGAELTRTGTQFRVWSRHASRLDLCLFDENDAEITRLEMLRDDHDLHELHVPGIGEAARYGFRAHGIHSPHHGLWYDSAKLLVDPYATEIDRPFRQDPLLADLVTDTARLVPKAIVRRHPILTEDPIVIDPAGLIYEVNVRSLTMLHPDIEPEQRGTIAALAHPAMIAHYQKIGVTHLELMPIVAWIDERHLPPLKLTNAWGYNPVAPMALDPRLAPGGVAELRQTVRILHQHNIGVILDLVFNHTGESDRQGPTLSMRGLDNLAYYRHIVGEPGTLINDAGCGNTLACDHPVVQRLVLDSLRHFVQTAGIDGFRFDLAPILGRTPTGFRREGGLVEMIANDPILKDRILIAEPWDIGLGGYQLGNFGLPYLEWNDRARDDLRMIWRGDRFKTGVLATVLAGSSDIFERGGATETRSLNFLAAHDGFTLADMVSYERKHNEANGEHNRDGHNENHSWNNGAEGITDDPAITSRRKADVKAMLGTLFASRGVLMLAAGDELGRTQGGNNNAYAQDNAMTWLDWQATDNDLIDHVAALAAIRKRFAIFSSLTFFTGRGDVTWINRQGNTMRLEDWQEADGDLLTMVLTGLDKETGKIADLAIMINRGTEPAEALLPGNEAEWTPLLGTIGMLDARSVAFALKSAKPK